jgi:hypothetical protein
MLCPSPFLLLRFHPMKQEARIKKQGARMLLTSYFRSYPESKNQEARSRRKKRECFTLLAS